MILEDLEWGLFEDSMVVGITKHIQVLLFTCAQACVNPGSVSHNIYSETLRLFWSWLKLNF